MIDRFEAVVRKARRAVSASEWSARLLGGGGDAGSALEPGLLMIQIDGLGRAELERAIAEGKMPFLGHLLGDEGYRLRRLYSGVPSTTPVLQGELFYGVRHAVPAFSFLDRESGRIVRMYEREPVAELEKRIGKRGGLLAGGSAYSDIYTGGAHEARFCMSSMRWSDLVRNAAPATLPLLAVVHSWAIARMAGLAVVEVVRALGGLVAGLAQGFDAWMELKFVTTRLTICVLLREILSIAAGVDVARGLPVVHVNLVGYDEHAHRRGPSSRFAHAALAGIDATVRRLTRAARRSSRRAYDVWVYSDHGQEETRPYVELYGRPVQEAVAEAMRAHGIESQAYREPRRGEQAARARVLLGERMLRFLMPGAELGGQWAEPGRLVVTAMGPLGHVYAPRSLGAEEREAIARSLTTTARIPLVLAAEGPGTARAWTADGTHQLPRDAGRVLGDDHPYLEHAARDLVETCHHPAAGEFVLSGWRLGATPLSFPEENGAHGGPGPRETDAFALLPADTPLGLSAGAALHTADLRDAALSTRGDSARRRAPVTAPTAAQERLRLMTYNVHSCLGMDGQLSPQRIARVIARYEPDVVALQEVDVGRERTGSVDQAAAIAGELEMLFHFHPAIAVEEEGYGDAVLTRHPLRLVRAGPLPGLPGRPDLEPRGALWVEVEVGGVTFEIINTHLSLHPRERIRQAESLVGNDWVGAARRRGYTILLGDLNALPRSPTCRRLGSALHDCQLVLADHRPHSTFFSRYPLGRIDYIFVDPELEVCAVEVPVNELTRTASDHLPLIAEVRVPGVTRRHRA